MLSQYRIISQEYIGGGGLVIKNQNCRPSFQLLLNLSKIGFR